MKKYLLLFSLCLVLLHTQCANAQKIKIKKPKLENIPGLNGSPAPLTETEIANGLKEALTKGANKASTSLNQTDAYFKNPLIKIPFPEEIQHVENTLRKMGFGNKVDEFILSMNRSAEQAAKESAPIFVNAIKSMTIADAKNILTGPDTAATGYLRKTTYNQLFTTFHPYISKALDNNFVGKQWEDLATIYNKLPTTKTKVDTDIARYTTHKALKGLFIKVAEEEKEIRQNPAARTSDLLKKVFGSNDKK